MNQINEEKRGIREVPWKRFFADIGNGRVSVVVVDQHLCLVPKQLVRKPTKYGNIDMIIREPIRLID